MKTKWKKKYLEKEKESKIERDFNRQNRVTSKAFRPTNDGDGDDNGDDDDDDVKSKRKVKEALKWGGWFNC